MPAAFPLMTGSHPVLEAFNKLIVDLAIPWTGVEIRTCCIRLSERWVNLGTRIQPITGSAAIDQRNFGAAVNLETFRCLREVRDSVALADLIRNVFGGEETIQGTRILFQSATQPESTLTPQMYFYDLERSRGKLGLAFASYVVQAVFSEGLRNILDLYSYETLEDSLHAQDAPVFGYNDILENFLEAPEYKGWWSPFVFVVIPIPIRMGIPATWGDAEVMVHVSYLDGIDEERVCVSMVSSEAQKGVVDRRKVPVPREGEPVAGIRGSLIRIPARPTMRNDLALMYGDIKVGTAVAFGPKYLASSPRMAAYAHVDSRTEKLGNLIGSKISGEFRRGIALLFTLMGYPTVDYEGINLTNSPDLLAIPSGAEPYVAIEATVAEPEYRSHIMKLSSRARELARVVAPQEVIPVLATGKDEVGPTEIEVAAKEGVALLTLNDMPTLAGLLQEPVNLARVAEVLKGLVPRL